MHPSLYSYLCWKTFLKKNDLTGFSDGNKRPVVLVKLSFCNPTIIMKFINLVMNFIIQQSKLSPLIIEYRYLRISSRIKLIWSNPWSFIKRYFFQVLKGIKNKCIRTFMPLHATLYLFIAISDTFWLFVTLCVKIELFHLSNFYMF